MTDMALLAQKLSMGECLPKCVNPDGQDVSFGKHFLLFFFW